MGSRNQTYAFLILLLATVLNLPLFAKPTLREIVESKVEPYLPFHYSLEVGVLQRDQVFFEGFSSHVEEPLPHERSIFGINSITKVFVDFMLAQLVLEQKMRFEEPAQSYLPRRQFPTFNGVFFSVLDLATHSSGLARLPDNMAEVPRYDPYSKYTDEELFRYLATAKLASAPGTTYLYSNLGFGLLGCLLANVEGKTFTQLWEQRIAKPMQLGDTHAFVDPETTTRLKHGHTPENLPLPPRSSSECMLGSWAGRSTAKDLLSFLKHHIYPELSPFRDAILQTQKPTSIIEGDGESVIGLGWDVRVRDKTYSKSGSGGGFSSFILFNQKAELGLVILSTSNPTAENFSASDLGWEIFKALPL